MSSSIREVLHSWWSVRKVPLVESFRGIPDANIQYAFNERKHSLSTKKLVGAYSSSFIETKLVRHLEKAEKKNFIAKTSQVASTRRMCHCLIPTRIPLQQQYNWHNTAAHNGNNILDATLDYFRKEREDEDAYERWKDATKTARWIHRCGNIPP